jgi:hypothetical protein
VALAEAGDAGALIAVVPPAARQLLFLLAPDLRPIEMRGDGLRAPALSGFLVPEGQGFMRVRHPLAQRRFMSVTEPSAERGFVRFDGPGDTALGRFRLLRLDAARVPPAVLQAASELSAACAYPMRAETILALIGEKKLRAALIEPVLRILPLDELEQFARILMTAGRALRILARALPGNRWFAGALPALADWQRRRESVAGGVMTSPVEDEHVGDPMEGFGLPQAGQAVCGLARAAVLPRRTACLLACARNEGPYLVEWLAYHFSIGFEHAFIYTNDNTDGSELLLEALAAAGAITLIHNHTGTHYGPQYKAYAHALNLLPQTLDYRWCAAIDIDEYVGFDTARFGGIAELLAWQETQPVDALAFCWLSFAAATGDRWRDEPTVQRFTRRDRAVDKTVKSMFKPRRAWHAHAHFPHATLDLPLMFRTESGAIHHHPHVAGRPAAFAERPSAEVGWINHYRLRSAQEALWKLARGQGDWKGDLSVNRTELALMISRSFVNLAEQPDLVEERESGIKAQFQAAMDRLTAAFVESAFPEEPAVFKAFRDLLRRG